jgi:hypothetical protein
LHCEKQRALSPSDHREAGQTSLLGRDIVPKIAGMIHWAESDDDRHWTAEISNRARVFLA